MPPTGACDIGGGEFRIIPKEDFSMLVQSTVSHGTDAAQETGQDEPRRIVGWVERCDYPTGADCGDQDERENVVLHSSNHNEERFALANKCNDLILYFDKFGGDVQYWQDEGAGTSEYKSCRTCGEPHLYCHEIFHMIDIPNGGTGRLAYCPKAPKETFGLRGSCAW